MERLKEVVASYKVDAIYPAMDSVIAILKENEDYLSVKIISSNSNTTKICLSKRLTYAALQGIVKLPILYNSLKDVAIYPVFAKPEIGYGSRGTKKILNIQQGESHLNEYPDSLILEYLPGKEYTVDCFTSFEGQLLFVGPRERGRIMNGISVNTKPVVANNELEEIALLINNSISFQGAWFFQVKENSQGELVLLEIASRLGGSSSLHRCLGINFALLSVFDAFNQKVSILKNSFDLEMDRALYSSFKLDITYDKVYIDYDDTLFFEGKINTTLIKFIFQCINRNISVFLITKHRFDLMSSLNSWRLGKIFDQVIHLAQDDLKFQHINPYNSIFIDDSFAERMQVFRELKIPVFSPDAIESLIQN